MKRNAVFTSGFNSLTGAGSGVQMREEFGGYDNQGPFQGWFSHEDLGCIDAPKLILCGGMYACADVDVAMPRTVMRGEA